MKTRFKQLERIRQNDKTPEEAIASYGSFVSYTNKLRLRAEKERSYLTGWTRTTVSLAHCSEEGPDFHEAIIEKFGFAVLREAIAAHPFK